MKILHIIPNLKKGGAERLVLDICTELSERKGIEVCLVTFSEDNDYEFISQRINHKVIPSKVIPSISGKKIIKTKELEESLFEFQPDVIHSHLWEAEMVSRHISFPSAIWVTHFHSNIPQLSKNISLSKRAVANRFERQILLRKYRQIRNTFICISGDTRKYATKVLPSSFHNNIHLLHNAINYQRFNLPKLKSTLNGTIKLVSIGSLVEKKNQLLQIRVVDFLLKQNIQVELHILGDGIMRNALEQEITQLNLNALVKLHGKVDDVENILNNCDFFIHTALSEPFGLVLIEAMASGLPVICLNGGGNKDLIVEGKNGFLIEERSPKIFAEKIIHLKDNPDEYSAMSNFAHKFAKQFDIKPYVDNLLKIYQS